MDRSFLSDPDVVAPSRGFICVRLVTYEDVQEMEFMQSIYVVSFGAAWLGIVARKVLLTGDDDRPQSSTIPSSALWPAEEKPARSG